MILIKCHCLTSTYPKQNSLHLLQQQDQENERIDKTKSESYWPAKQMENTAGSFQLSDANDLVKLTSLKENYC